MTCKKRGNGNCFIMASEFTNTVVASLIVEDMKPQIISPDVIKGRNSCIGDLNNLPKIKPIQATITAVDIVIQKGPSVDLL